MENQEDTLQDRLVKFLKQNLFISALFFLGLMFLVIGLIQFLGRSNSQSIQFEKGEEVKSDEISANSKIIVDVSGEVMKPGVYELGSDSRIKDAIDRAGGISSSADSEYVSKSLNLALKLTDGMKIYIPAFGESPPLGVSSLSLGNKASLGGLISINSSSQSELESLPGVGPVTAGKIIDLRPYTSIQELLDKKAVGKSVFEKIKDLISL